MCVPGLFSSPPRDHSAEIARQQEAERQQRVTAARGNVDTAFQPFNDQYYGGYRTAYIDYYNPQLREQYGDARRTLVTRLAQSGNLASSYGADQIGRLDREYQRRGSQIVDEANASANDFRSRVEQQRSNLYNLATSAEDPAAVGAQATTMASTLQAPPVFSPLANAFGDFLNTAAIAVANERRGYTGTGTGLFRPASTASSGSARYVA